MKKLRIILAFGIVTAFAAVLIMAADDKKPAEEKNPVGCDCGKDKDGKVCGVDKDCCCTGKKATKPQVDTEKKDEKKSPAKGGSN